MKFTFMTKTTQKLLVLTGIFSMGILAVPSALADNHEDMMESPTEMQNEEMMEQSSTEAGNIVEVASGNDTFSILVQAVEAAELGDTLSDPSASYTVFAPTDEALFPYDE